MLALPVGAVYDGVRRRRSGLPRCRRACDHPGCNPMIPTTVIVVATAFPARLSAARVAAALQHGLSSGAGAWVLDAWTVAEHHNGVKPLTDDCDPRSFAQRLHAARALVLAAADSFEELQPSDAIFDLATDARQGGIPAYAVCARTDTDPFTARVMDLQVVLAARSTPQLIAAGRTLAALV